ARALSHAGAPRQLLGLAALTALPTLPTLHPPRPLARRLDGSEHRKAEAEPSGPRVHEVHGDGGSQRRELGSAERPRELARQVDRDDLARTGLRREGVRPRERRGSWLRGGDAGAPLERGNETVRGVPLALDEALLA